MTPAEGFGMLAVGLIAIAIGGTVFFFVVNKLQDIEKKKKEGTITKEEQKKLQEIGNYLDSFYGDDNRG